MNPVAKAKGLTRYAKRSPMSAATSAIVLFAVLVAIALVRRGALPSERGFAALAGAALVVIALAQVLPDEVAMILLAAVVVTAVQDGGATIVRLVDQGTAAFRSAIETA